MAEFLVASTTQRESIVRLREWCEDNYTNGADTMVECWMDSDFLDTLVDPYTGEQNAEFYALSILKSVAEVYADWQADARHYVENE
jgi:hypothetical protein